MTATDTPRTDSVYSLPPDRAGAQFAMCRDLERENARLKAALGRAVPWLGKLIADGGHLNAVAPNDAIGAMDQAQAALDKVQS